MSEAPHAPAPLADDPADGLSHLPVQRGPILRLLGLVFVGVLVGYALFDYGVGAYDSNQDTVENTASIFKEERLGWVNRPHFENPKFQTSLDRFGLRNPEIPETLVPDEVRILGLGASRIYGAGGAMQPWCWNYKLEQRLAGADSHIRALNGGVNGYSCLQACRLAIELLDTLEPDLVFVLASPRAQLMLDPSSARNWVRVSPGPDGLLPADVVEGWGRPFWPVVASVHNFLSKASAIYRRHRAKFQVNEDRAESIQRWMISEAPNSPEVQAMLTRTFDEVEALGQACRERGIELRLMLLSEIDQDSEEAWEQFLRLNQNDGAPPIGTPRRQPMEVLARLTAERGVKSWDFFDEIDTMGQDRGKYVMPLDKFHWSEKGHELIARGIVKRMQAEGLLEQLVQSRREHPRTRPFGPYPFQQPGS